jgi:hypothetical protein
VNIEGFCRNKRNRQSNACLISAKIQSIAPCASEVEVAPLNRTHYCSVKGERDESKTRGVRA